MKMKEGKKIVLTAVSAALACVVLAGGTMAYLHTEAKEVTNTFTPAGNGKLVNEKGFALKEHKVAFFPNEVASDGAIGAYHYVNPQNEEITVIEDETTPLAGPEGAKVVSKNTYDKVLPGMTLPKDPYVEIKAEDKTEIASFLYIRVDDQAGGQKPEYYKYDIDIDDGRGTGNWAALTGIGGVYVYTAGTGGAVPIAGKDGKLQYGTLAGNEMTWTDIQTGEDGFLRINILKDKKVTIDAKAAVITNWRLDFYGCMAQAFNVSDAAEVYRQAFGTAQSGNEGGSSAD